jgi:hypothetical protein
MISYKRGTTPTLPVTVDVDISTVSKIEFIFKQQNSESSTKLVLKTYPTDVEYDSTKKLFYVYFTEDETRKFIENRPFYMDTRITYTGGKIPKTPIIELMMNNTLFTSTD